MPAGAGEGAEPYAGPPAGTVLRPSWAHDSPPLQAMLGTMWENSDNLLAECLLRTLSVYHADRPGTTADGVAAELDYLRAIGVAGAVSLHDGSGLSIYDRATPRALVALLSALWKGPTRPTVLAALPVAGVRGTLGAFAGTPAEGRIFAKTGSMMHVRALAGRGDAEPRPGRICPARGRLGRRPGRARGLQGGRRLPLGPLARQNRDLRNGGIPRARGSL